MEESYLYTWEDSVDNFFAFGRELGVDSYTYGLMELLVNTENDLKRFVESYDGDLDNWKTTLYKILPHAA